MYRINTGTKAVDLFGSGKHGFKDGNKALGVAATAFEAAWPNAMQEEIANVIELSGATLDSADNTQLASAIQSGKLNSVVAGGITDAWTATFTPEITTIADQTIFVRTGSANTIATPTLAVDGLAAITIVKGNNLPLAVGDMAGAGHWAEIKLDATLGKAVLLNPANGVIAGASVVGTAKNLKIDSVGVNNYSCIITADEAVLENSVNQFLTVRAINQTIDANGAVGAPLSIMSARAASTWYYRWLWYNAANGLTATLDVSPTAPTAPTGYVSGDYKAVLAGACRTDGSGSTYLVQIRTLDGESQYGVLTGSNTPNMPFMATGVQGSITTPTWVAVAVGAFVPPTAKSVKLVLVGMGDGGSGSAAAPNNGYGTVQLIGSAQVNPAPLFASSSSNTIPKVAVMGEFMLESGNIYYAAGNIAGALCCMGWR